MKPQRLVLAMLLSVVLLAACSSPESARTNVTATTTSATPISSATPTSPSTSDTSNPPIATPSSSSIALRDPVLVAPGPGPLAIVRAGNDLVGVQPGNPVLWKVPGAVSSLDGSAVAWVSVGHGRTTVVVNDTRSAATTGTWTIEGELSASVVAPKGRFVALVSHLSGETRLVVVHAASNTITDRTLRGHVRPEAFSIDGATLFALDDRPAAKPTYYRVQAINVATGDRYDTNDRDKAEQPEDMTGSSVRAVVTPDGKVLSTLYRNPGKTPAAFVHVLNLEMGYTYCADLPLPFGTGAVGTDSIALSPDGATLMVSSAGRFATVDLEPLRTYGDSPIAIKVTSTSPTTAPLLNPLGAAATADGILDVRDGAVHLGSRSTTVVGVESLLAVAV
jgi:hypothetical protein